MFRKCVEESASALRASTEAPEGRVSKGTVGSLGRFPLFYFSLHTLTECCRFVRVIFEIIRSPLPFFFL